MLVAVHVCLFLSFPVGDQVMPRRRDVSKSCCLSLHLNEDNARFGLLGVPHPPLPAVWGGGVLRTRASL